MQKPIPWKASAIIATKRRGDVEFIPEIAGLTLNAALTYVTSIDHSTNKEICIWLNWSGEEVRLQGPDISQLATDPERPALPSD